jgi:hypothetical protein
MSFINSKYLKGGYYNTPNGLLETLETTNTPSLPSSLNEKSISLTTNSFEQTQPSDLPSSTEIGDSPSFDIASLIPPENPLNTSNYKRVSGSGRCSASTDSLFDALSGGYYYTGQSETPTSLDTSFELKTNSHPNHRHNNKTYKASNTKKNSRNNRKDETISPPTETTQQTENTSADGFLKSLEKTFSGFTQSVGDLFETPTSTANTTTTDKTLTPSETETMTKNTSHVQKYMYGGYYGNNKQGNKKHGNVVPTSSSDLPAYLHNRNSSINQGLNQLKNLYAPKSSRKEINEAYKNLFGRPRNFEETTVTLSPSDSEITVTGTTADTTEPSTLPTGTSDLLEKIMGQGDITNNGHGKSKGNGHGHGNIKGHGHGNGNIKGHGHGNGNIKGHERGNGNIKGHERGKGNGHGNGKEKKVSAYF